MRSTTIISSLFIGSHRTDGRMRLDRLCQSVGWIVAQLHFLHILRRLLGLVLSQDGRGSCLPRPEHVQAMTPQRNAQR